jgi:hypothetical protein
MTWVLLTGRVEEHEAREHAEGVLAEAARRAGVAVPAITGITSRLRDLTGRPRRIPTPPGRYEAVDVGDRNRLLAVDEGPLGDWVAHLESEPDRAWAGRDLRAVLRRLLNVPSRHQDARVDRAVEMLAGHRTPLGVRYACPCCDFLTLEERPPGTWAICPVCWWEDDDIQFHDLDYRGGANRPSLREARERYRSLGVSEPRLLKHARAPLPAEIP